MENKINVKSIEALIKRLPKFKDCIVRRVKDSGVSTEVFRLIGKKQNYYLRLSDFKENISTEVLAHKMIIEKGVKAPIVLYYEDFNKLINRSFIITTEIRGKPVKKIKNLPKKVLIEAGKQLALINSIPIKSFGWFDCSKPNAKKLEAEYKNYQDFALDFSNIEAMLNDLKKAKIFNKGFSKKYLEYIRKNQNLIKCKQAYLAHGDFCEDHIYVYKNKYSGIIDFGDIRATSQYHDLAHFYKYSSKYFDSLLEGYRIINSLEDDYMQKIEFVATLFTLGKLWHKMKNCPEQLKKKRNDFELLKSVLSNQ